MEPGFFATKRLLRLGLASALVAVAVASLFLSTSTLRSPFTALKQRLLSPLMTPWYLGDRGPARDLILCYPMGLAFSREGHLLIVDRGRDRRGRVIWRIDDQGIAQLLAGSGRQGDATETDARKISFRKPEDLAVADDGSVYVSDGFNHTILKIAESGTVTRVAGTGRPGFSGDGGHASVAALNRPADIRFDSKGNLFVADVLNHRIRRIDPDGLITTVAGTGKQGWSPDGSPAVQASLDTPWGIAIDSNDRLIIGDGGNHAVRRVESDGRLTTIAGNGRPGFDGDGGRAVDASLNFPEGLAFDSEGRLYIGDESNNAIRRVELDGSISTVMGTGLPGRAAIEAPATGSPLNDPENVLVGPQGGLFISDGNNGRVIRISEEGSVQHIAGLGDIERCSSIF